MVPIASGPAASSAQLLQAACLPRARAVPHVAFACLLVPVQDARRAFKALAYKRYQHVPLYLEWAPRSIFTTPPMPRAAAKPAAQPAQTSAAAAAEKPGKAAGELLTGLAEAEGEEAESSSIFVKNLAWATGDAALRKHFDAAVSAAGALGWQPCPAPERACVLVWGSLLQP
jgi:multiple RNA-binding domain-containing protein 1